MLPKKSSGDEPLTPVQLIMLWLIWGSGMTVGTMAFLVELKAGSRTSQGEWARERQHNVAVINEGEWAAARIEGQRIH